MFGSCHGWSTCTFTKTTREAPLRIDIMSSKSASVIGPLVLRATMTSAPELALGLQLWRIASPSAHWRLTAASTLMPGMSASRGSW